MGGCRIIWPTAGRKRKSIFFSYTADIGDIALHIKKTSFKFFIEPFWVLNALIPLIPPKPHFP